MILFNIDGTRIESTYEDVSHHGIKGQKWGVRRFQNPDGSLTPEGKERYKEAKRIYGNKETVLKKSGEFFRISSQKESDAKPGSKLYATPNEYEHGTYKVQIATSNMLKHGEAWVHKYISENDIRIPSVKLQTKIETKLLKDKEVRDDIIESLMRKGSTREEATARLYASEGKANAARLAMGVLAVPAMVNPVAGAMLAVAALAPNEVTQDKLFALRASVGDKEANVLNRKLTESIKSKGYNAYRDTNDRNKSIAKSSIIILDPDINVKLAESHRINKQEYAEAYADYKLRTGVLKKYSSKEVLIKDGEKAYDAIMKKYALNKNNKAYKANVEKEVEKYLQ